MRARRTRAKPSRRSFLRTAGGLALASAVPIPASAQGRAQDRHKTFQVGYVANIAPLSSLAGPVPSSLGAQAILEGLRDSGLTEGAVRVHWRSAEQRYERRPALFEELLRLPIDVLVVEGNASTEDALGKTRTVPIVSIGMDFPVESGLVASIARPGGNVTGLLNDAGPEIVGKRLALLKQVSPRIGQVAYLLAWYADLDRVVEKYPETVAAARALGLTLLPARVESVELIEAAIDAAVRQGADALHVGNWAPFAVPANIERIARAAVRHRLPAVYARASAVEYGGLIGYGTDPLNLSRRAGQLVARILKGTRPADIPIETPSRLVLQINAGAARAIGVQVPAALAISANRVID